MNRWKQEIYNKIKGFKSLAILCIGNPQASDDGVGPKIGEKLSEILGNHSNVYVFNCYNTPENFTSPVKKMMPDHILIIDSCISGKRPGTISVFDSDKLKETDVSSHRIPVKLLSMYLEKETGAEVIITGIEPEVVDKGEYLSKAVKEAADDIIKFLSGIIKDCYQRHNDMEI